MTKKEIKQLLLDELYAPYTQCVQCPLGTLGRTHVVFGRGNPDAALLLVGEAPGRDEDLQGQPFIGRSGKLLSKTLEALAIDEKELYITNIVKCRPPQNRAPLPNESAICTKLLLEKQIKIIAPSVICALGSCATNLLLETTTGISKLRGIPQPYKSTLLIPTYHPAYILRNPKELKTLAYDLQAAYEAANSNKK